MSHRIALPVFVVSAIAYAASACSGSEVGGASVVTSLPSSDPVTSDATQLCSDIVTYLTGLSPSLAGLDCANQVEAQESIAAGGAPVMPSGTGCRNEYETCLSAVDGADASAVQSAMSSLASGCASSLAKCQGATVGQVATCIADLGNALVAVSSSATEDAVCSGKTSSFPYPAPPASCTALPSDCPLAQSSVTISSGG
jgi:copper chaperone CopZ